MDKKYESYLLIEKNLLREHNFFWLQTSAKNERRSSTKNASEIFFLNGERECKRVRGFSR